MPQIPDYIESIIAYRVWRARWQSTELYSLSTSYTWKPYPESAACILKYSSRSKLAVSSSPHIDKQTPCMGRCGFYGLKTLPELTNFLQRNWRSLRYKGDLILGKISLWGEILEYDRGYRAQYAYPESIWDNGAVPDYLIGRAHETNIEDIAATYDIEISKMPDSLFNQLPRR